MENKPQSNTCSMTFEFGCKKAETKRASPKSRSGQIRVVGSSSSSSSSDIILIVRATRHASKNCAPKS